MDETVEEYKEAKREAKALEKVLTQEQIKTEKLQEKVDAGEKDLLDLRDAFNQYKKDLEEMNSAHDAKMKDLEEVRQKANEDIKRISIELTQA